MQLHHSVFEAILHPVATYILVRIDGYELLTKDSEQ